MFYQNKYKFLRQSTIPCCLILLLLSLPATTLLFAAELVLTDPTRPGNLTSPVHFAVTKNKASYTLSQIYINKQSKIAIINNQKVRTGDWLNNAKVVNINSDSVHLLINDTIKILTIAPSIKNYND